MKYDEKRKQLRKYFEENRFPGGKIPSEKELAALFDLNLGGVREILREFEMLGLISKRRGQGNYLNASVMKRKMRIDDNCSFFTIIEQGGYTTGEKAELCQRSLAGYDEKAMALLSVPNRERLICFEELFTADEAPAIFSYMYSLADYYGQVDWQAIRQDTAALKNQLKSRFEIYYAHSLIEISAAVAEEHVAMQLKIEPQTPLILWTEEYYNIYDEAMGMGFHYFNPQYLNLSIVRLKRS